jgi:tRNA (guanine37-N1)-methyltransferase
MTPAGAPLTQARVRELSALPHVLLVCGRYEGIDERVIELAIDEQLSIGDYVLSGGELAALVVIDAVSRFVPGVLGEASSVDDESHSAGLLEYPQYTRPLQLPAEARSAAGDAGAGDAPAAGAAGDPGGPATPPAVDPARDVPAILTSGNHAAIAAWRRRQAIDRTAQRRPDLFARFRPAAADRKVLPPALQLRTHLALVHHPVVDRTGQVITTALTNFDIHDLARSSLTYGLAGYHVVTPITSQRDKATHIARLWIDDAQGEHRARALRLVRTAGSIDEVIEALAAEHGRPPRVVASSARAGSFPNIARRSPSALRAEASVDPAPMLVLLGTGWGLAEALIPSVSCMLEPIEGAADWNHLSVRSAGAILLDRLFGDLTVR